MPQVHWSGLQEREENGEAANKQKLEKTEQVSFTSRGKKRTNISTHLSLLPGTCSVLCYLIAAVQRRLADGKCAAFARPALVTSAFVWLSAGSMRGVALDVTALSDEAVRTCPSLVALADSWFLTQPIATGPLANGSHAVVSRPALLARALSRSDAGAVVAPVGTDGHIASGTGPSLLARARVRSSALTLDAALRSADGVITGPSSPARFAGADVGLCTRAVCSAFDFVADWCHADVSGPALGARALVRRDALAIYAAVLSADGTVASGTGPTLGAGAGVGRARRRMCAFAMVSTWNATNGRVAFSGWPHSLCAHGAVVRTPSHLTRAGALARGGATAVACPVTRAPVVVGFFPGARGAIFSPEPGKAGLARSLDVETGVTGALSGGGGAFAVAVAGGASRRIDFAIRFALTVHHANCSVAKVIFAAAARARRVALAVLAAVSCKCPVNTANGAVVGVVLAGAVARDTASAYARGRATDDVVQERRRKETGESWSRDASRWDVRVHREDVDHHHHGREKSKHGVVVAVLLFCCAV